MYTKSGCPPGARQGPRRGNGRNAEIWRGPGVNYGDRQYFSEAVHPNPSKTDVIMVFNNFRLSSHHPSFNYICVRCQNIQAGPGIVLHIKSVPRQSCSQLKSPKSRHTRFSASWMEAVHRQWPNIASRRISFLSFRKSQDFLFGPNPATCAKLNSSLTNRDIRGFFVGLLNQQP